MRAPWWRMFRICVFTWAVFKTAVNWWLYGYWAIHAHTHNIYIYAFICRYHIYIYMRLYIDMRIYIYTYCIYKCIHIDILNIIISNFGCQTLLHKVDKVWKTSCESWMCCNQSEWELTRTRPTLLHIHFRIATSHQICECPHVHSCPFFNAELQIMWAFNSSTSWRANRIASGCTISRTVCMGILI